MDNNKIGKLIAEQRKKLGLTQQDLGDMVGVGSKAVSKWECGTTLPDITIINEVSKILGLTMDELLSGKINEPIEVEEKIEENNVEVKETKKGKTKLKITISIITILLIFTVATFIYQTKNQTYTYDIVSRNKEECYIEGKAYLKNNKITININELHFIDEKFSEITINNYEYNIILNNELIFGYGYLDSLYILESPTTIKMFSKNFKQNIDINTNISKSNITEKNWTLKFRFLTSEDEIIEKEIKLQIK